MNLLDFLLQRKLTAYQSRLMAQQVEEVEQMYRRMRGWRHDYHNHLQTLDALAAALPDGGEIRDYLRELTDDLASVDTLLRSGNVTADALLNTKVSLAESRGIRVEAKAAIPAVLPFPEVELCVILGNLLDNATEACAGLEEPWIRLYIRVLREQLYISVSNAAKGRVLPRGGRYVTHKEGMHGLGLLRVDSLVKKLGGFVNRQSEEGVFATEVLLPLWKREEK